MDKDMDDEMDNTVNNKQFKGQDNVQPLRSKIKQTWSNLTDVEITSYEQGRRDTFLAAVQNKQGLSREQAEKILLNMENQYKKAA